MLDVRVIENKKMIIAGDLNCKYLINNQRKIKDAIKLNGLKQLVDQPTRITITSKTLIEVYSNNSPKQNRKTLG